MNKDILRNYEAMNLEKKDIEKRISALEAELKKYKKDYQEQDSVSGGAGGMQRFKIRGFPYPEYEKKKTLLLSRKMKLETLAEKIEQEVGEVESYINNLDNPVMRLILRLRYLDGRSWEAVAEALGPGHSKDAVRKKCERFMSEEE